MPTYFKPLRRKMGVLTLVVTCVIAVGLVRSLFVSNFIELLEWTATDSRVGISLGNCWFNYVSPAVTLTVPETQSEWEVGLYGFFLQQWHFPDGRQVVAGRVPL